MKRANFIPLLTRVWGLVQSGTEYHSTLSDLNPQMRHAAIKVFIRSKVEDLDLKIGEVSVLNADARDDLASFVSHVSLALGKVAGKGAA